MREMTEWTVSYESRAFWVPVGSSGDPLRRVQPATHEEVRQTLEVVIWQLAREDNGWRVILETDLKPGSWYKATINLSVFVPSKDEGSVYQRYIAAVSTFERMVESRLGYPIDTSLRTLEKAPSDCVWENLAAPACH